MTRMRGIRYPAAQRLAYLRLLNSLIDQLTQYNLETLLNSVQIAWILTDIAKKIEHMTQEDFQKQVAPVLGVAALAIPSTNELRKLFVHQNLKLIKSLSQNQDRK